MSGVNSTEDQTYLTAPMTYRTGITAPDVSPTEDANGDDVPDIRVDVDESALYRPEGPASATSHKYLVSKRAYNAHLSVFVHLSGPNVVPGMNDGIEAGVATSHADIRVWGWSEPDDGQLVARWCLVHEQTVQCDTLIVLRDLPNCKYRVTVDDISAGSRVDMIDRHTI